VSSSKFAVLDRNQQQAIQSEFSIITSGNSSVENNVRLQATAISDFLIILDLTDFNKSLNGLDRLRVKVGVRAIVYDYTSGQVRQSVKSVTSRLVRENSMSNLGEDLGAELGQKIIDNVFPALVIGFDANTVSINAGQGQFEVGDVVSFYRQGSALKDPYTKEALGFSESYLGEGVVESVLPKISIVRLDGLK
jgi:hypothetical protein